MRLFFSKFYIFNITSTIIMSVMVVVLNLLMIPVWGIEGAALASFISMFIYNLIKYLYVKKRLGFDPFTIDIAKIIILGGLYSCLDYYMLPKFNSVILDIIFRLGLLSLFYASGIWIMNIATDSQKIVLNKYRIWKNRASE